MAQSSQRLGEVGGLHNFTNDLSNRQVVRRMTTRATTTASPQSRVTSNTEHDTAGEQRQLGELVRATACCGRAMCRVLKCR